MLAREGEAKGSYPLREGEGVPRRRERTRRDEQTHRQPDGQTDRQKQTKRDARPKRPRVHSSPEHYYEY